MDPRLKELNDELRELNNANRGIRAACDAEGREPTHEENEAIDANAARFVEINEEIARRETMDSQEAILAQTTGRLTDPNGVDGAQNGGGAAAPTPARPRAAVDGQGRSVIAVPGASARTPISTRLVDAGRHGFTNFGQFTATVIGAALNPGHVDKRLYDFNNAGQAELSGQDGGFLVPPDFRQTIMEKVAAEDSLIGRTDQLTTSSNSIVIPSDEIPQWDEARGVQASWEGEKKKIDASQHEFDQLQVRANKLTAMVRVTDELMEDAPALESYLRRKVPEKFDFKINMAMIHGTGVGMPLGVMKSGFTVEAPSSTAAATMVDFADILAMWGRMPARWRSNAIWNIHPDLEEALPKMKFDAAANSPVPVYMPAGGLSTSGYATLMGRPVVPTEVCAAPSDPGDIILAAWSQYMSLTKSTGLQVDSSIHVYFDTAEQALRFILRVGGMPWWKNPIASRVGGTNRSGFVTLADRT